VSPISFFSAGQQNEQTKAASNRRSPKLKEIAMIPTITREQLQRKLEHGGNVTLVETGPESDYHDSHVPSAIHLPPDQVRELATQLLPDKEAEIVVYCGGPTCNASEIVAGELVALGYTNVRVYKGGKWEWIEAGLPTEGGVPLATPY